MSLLSIFLCFSTYLILLAVYNELEKREIHSFSLRMFNALLSWICLLSFCGYCFSVVMAAYEYLAGNPYAGVPFMGIMILTGLLVYVFTLVQEKLNFGEMKNFIRASLFFDNYFRRRDYQVRQEMESDRMKRLYREMTGKELTPDVTATPYDESVKRSPRIGRKNVISVIAETHRENLELLKNNPSVDLSECFRFELMKSETEFLLTTMQHFEMDTRNAELKIRFHLRETPVIDLTVLPVRNRFLGDLYVSLRILLSQEWLTPYQRYFNRIRVSVLRLSIDDSMKTVRHTVAETVWDVRKMEARGTRITDAADIGTVASVEFFDTTPKQ